MKVLEVQNNLVKIEFSQENSIALGCFLVIEDDKTPFVAQVMNLNINTEKSIAVTKLLFTFDENGILKNYNGTVPAIDSEVSILPVKELLDILPVDQPLKLGEINNKIISVDTSIFEDNLLICSDNKANTNLLMNNILSQLNDYSIKNIVFDLDGNFEVEKCVKFTQDFKIPLNYDTINFIYENDLNDVEPISKALIQDIFIEVQEYSKSVENGFIPFDTFINVIEAQYNESKIPQLVLLKNKLLKYKENGVFAQTLPEAKSLNKILELEKNIVIDLSTTDNEPLKEQVLEIAYSILNNLPDNSDIFISLENEYANKPLLKLLTSSKKAFTTIICPHEFKYIDELKSVSKNMILFTPLKNNTDFAAYNTFLNKLNSDEFLIIGDLTQQIPFIVQFTDLNSIESNMPETESTPVMNKTIQNDESFDTENMINIDEADGNIEDKPPLEISLPAEDISVEDTLNLADEINNNNDFNTELEDSNDENLQTSVVEEIDDNATDTEFLNNEQEPAIEEPVIEESEIEELSINEPATGVPVEAQTLDDISIEEYETSPEISETPLNISTESEDESENVIDFNNEDNNIDEEFNNEPTNIEEDNLQNTSTDNELTVLDEDNDLEDLVEISNNKENVSDEELILEDTPIQSTQPDNSFFEDDEVTNTVKKASNEDISNVILDDPQDEEFVDANINFEDNSVVIGQIPGADENDFAKGTLNEVLNDAPINNDDDDVDAILDEINDNKELINNKKKATSPVIPIYPAKELDKKNTEEFREGDKVIHPTYGKGKVEKLITYGNKKLCSIIFENNNRRLLDPSISSLKRLF